MGPPRLRSGASLHKNESMVTEAVMVRPPPKTQLRHLEAVEKGTCRNQRGQLWVSTKGRVKCDKGLVQISRDGDYSFTTIAGRRVTIPDLLMHYAVGPKPEGMQNNHKDLDTTNNCLENLERVTQSENIQHSYRTNTKRQTCAAQRGVAVRGRQVGSQDWHEFPTVSEAGRVLGIKPSNISSILTRNSKRAKAKKRNNEWWTFERVPVVEVLPGETWRPVIIDNTETGACMYRA